MVGRFLSTRVALLTAWGVVGCAPAQVEEQPEKKECNLSFDTLPGTTWTRQEPGEGASYKEDIWARARFFKDGDKLKVKYNTRSLADMYVYTCEKAPGELLCKADNVDLQQWCYTLYANKGSCSAAQLADVTGAKVVEAQSVADAVNAEIKKMKKDEVEKLKVSYAQPNNQLRGIFHVKVQKEECRINVRDNYQTMTYGELREVENYVGNARFEMTDRDLVFEHCGDQQKNLVMKPSAEAVAQPMQTKQDWKPGETVFFEYVGEDAKPEPGCAYTMDTWATYAPLEKGATVPSVDGKLRWAWSHAFSEAGRQTAHLYRYKACNGAGPELYSVSCAILKVE